jgi:hypothetical protein
MSFAGNAQIVGSMSLKSQVYAGDYDMVEEVHGSYKTDEAAAAAYARRLQDIVSQLMSMPSVYIGDIKAGVIPEWEVIPESAGIRKGAVVGYDAEQARQKVDQMAKDGVLTASERTEALRLLKPHPSVEEFLLLKKDLRFHIVRWTPTELQHGSVRLRDGRTYTLTQAILSPGIVKLDVVAYVQQSRFTDFSIIYLFFNSRGKVLNKTMGDTIWLIKQDLLYYLVSGNYFKAAKRLFSLARHSHDSKLIAKLNTLLNSDLGRLYLLLSDMGTLQFLLENEATLPAEKIRYELDQFRGRLGNIYAVKSDSVLRTLIKATGFPNNAKGRASLHRTLERLQRDLEHLLSQHAKVWLKDNHLLPLPAKYRP